jgi:hypothetical protein
MVVAISMRESRIAAEDKILARVGPGSGVQAVVKAT